MAILDSIQKERLLWQVQQHGYSIRIDEVARLIMEYENLEVGDFAPPVLPPELYEQLKDLFKDHQEEDAWKQLLQRPKGSEEEIIELIREAESYISNYKSSKQSHANEASSMLNDLRNRLELLQKEKNLKIQEERCAWKYLVNMPHANEKDLNNLIQETHDFLLCHADSPYIYDAQILLDKLYTQKEEMQRPRTVSYVQKSITPVLEDLQEERASGDKNSWFKRLFGKRVSYDNVFCSAFAPAEVKRKSHMLVQVYLHLQEETEKVKSLAQESDKDAERRDYIPLQCKLKKGDKVDVLLNIYGETLLMSDKKSIVWQGTFTKCSFDYFVPKDIDLDELSCVALLSVNGVPVGEMRFITKIVEQPRQLNPEILAHKYNRVFISYSHQDESKVKFLHEGLELGSVPHFFDRKYLKAGDVFPQVIQDYINSADLFILCWSENASKSEYVQKERLQALERAFPQVQPEKAAKLRIYPMSIEPRAELPSDMKENYHFGEL